MSSITELENQKWNEVLNSPEGKETLEKLATEAELDFLNGEILDGDRLIREADDFVDKLGLFNA